ncbi:hypothetical protein [Teichococcus aestuarii]|uniref:hypothetical protein n=1 Tax=Teichococcus aestuarii TaxID=568898 RepID=UPI0036101654
MKVFLTHTETAFANYYGERPLAALSRHAEVVRNPTGRVLQGAALAEAAAGCHAIVADRATPGRPRPSPPRPTSWPSCAARWTSAPSTSPPPRRPGCW